jgi:hypothetical protein
MENTTMKNIRLGDLEIPDNPREISHIRQSSLRKEYLILQILTNSLKHQGIFENDFLVVNTDAEFTEDVLSAFQTPDGVTIGYAYENFDDVAIHNQNGKLMRFPAKKVKHIGVVCRIERDFTIYN